ncbi:MAG: calcium/sodium antiporter, partial [Muribaculaceae bacterium]|nr:calcium/sodium antiporter [Muribaculaceae bacterium]
ILLFLLGLALVVAGGNYLTDGATVIARRLHVSGMVIGLTVVAFGSSAPDLVVCLMSTIQGHSQLALGDVVGANIFDILLVVGIVAVIRPVSITADMQWKGLPMVALASLALFFCGDDRLFDGAATDSIDRTDGLMLLLFFAIFMVYTFDLSRRAPAARATPKAQKAQKAQKGQADGTPVSRRQLIIATASVVASLAALFFGGDWLVDGASGIARRAGLSEGLIGLTVVGFGGSVPDLVTSVAAAIKRQPGLALGNVVGTCVFNIFFVLGICATVRPLDTGTISLFDFSALVVGAMAVWVFGAMTGPKVISRREGVVLILLYAIFATRLVVGLVNR